ncbi:MAG: carbon storage regulator [Planctomycetales bacterium]|nr:carbon storage regulator [Planctomycetales bacterium]
MLVLSRKDGEQIVIGDDVVVSILRIAGNRVRIGIEAPESVHIVRGELDLFADESRNEFKHDLIIESEYHEPVS